jgi:mono/diheme cytochrome c family protein
MSPDRWTRALAWVLVAALAGGATALVACREEEGPEEASEGTASEEAAVETSEDEDASEETAPATGARQSTWTLVSEKCGQCHELSVVTEARLDWEGWSASVDHMVEQGAQLTDIERDAIATYLSTRQEVAERGFAIVEAECVVCHTLTVIDEARLDWDGWETAVEHMVEQGAPLDQEQAEAVIEYLATSESP